MSSNLSSGSNAEGTGRILTMEEAMIYLTDHGFSCRSRSTFYRLLDDFNIHYVNTNPSGKYAVRRFPLSSLNKFLIEQGIVPNEYE